MFNDDFFLFFTFIIPVALLIEHLGIDGRAFLLEGFLNSLLAELADYEYDNNNDNYKSDYDCRYHPPQIFKIEFIGCFVVVVFIFVRITLGVCGNVTLLYCVAFGSVLINVLVYLLNAYVVKQGITLCKTACNRFAVDILGSAGAERQSYRYGRYVNVAGLYIELVLYPFVADDFAVFVLLLSLYALEDERIRLQSRGKALRPRR